MSIWGRGSDMIQHVCSPRKAWRQHPVFNPSTKKTRVQFTSSLAPTPHRVQSGPPTQHSSACWSTHPCPRAWPLPPETSLLPSPKTPPESPHHLRFTLPHPPPSHIYCACRLGPSGAVDFVFSFSEPSQNRPWERWTRASCHLKARRLGML